MEREFKWQADYSLQKAILQWAQQDSTVPVSVIEMDARYYDTPDGVLTSRKIGLRVRRENQAAVCCLKLRGDAQNGLHTHQEFECAAPSLADGWQGLLQSGAPPSLIAELSALPLTETCRTVFTRSAVLLSNGSFSAELAFDSGTLQHGAKSAPLTEIELEYKAGSYYDFLALGEKITALFSLNAQPLSKLARALSL